MNDPQVSSAPSQINSSYPPSRCTLYHCTRNCICVWLRAPYAVSGLGVRFGTDVLFGTFFYQHAHVLIYVAPGWCHYSQMQVQELQVQNNVLMCLQRTLPRCTLWTGTTCSCSPRY